MLLPSDCVTVALASATFSYLPPTITSIQPSSGPAAGGTVVTVTGSGFSGTGTVPVIELEVSSVASYSGGTLGPTSDRLLASSTRLLASDQVVVRRRRGTVLFFNDTTVVAQLPGAAGVRQSLVVTHGASGAAVALPGAFSFDPPFITGFVPRGAASSSRHNDSTPTRPCNGYNTTTLPTDGSWDDRHCLDVWLPASGGVVDVYGRNFGGDAASAALTQPSVSVGGVQCLPLPGQPLYVSDGQLTCEIVRCAELCVWCVCGCEDRRAALLRRF